MFRRKSTQIFVLCFSLLCLTIFSCQPDDFDPIKPSEITKKDRENLGDQIFLAINNAPDEFPILANIPPYDTTVYYLVQNLFDQVSNPFRKDQLSSLNSWDENRPWKITVIDKEEKDAFALPGGYFFITKGLLLHLKEEFELYYVLAFETSLIDQKYLLTRLINIYNTEIINDISNSRIKTGAPSAINLARELALLEMEQEDIVEADRITAELICESSLFDRKGILSILQNTFDESMLWLNKKSYSNRAGSINSLVDDELLECGDFQTNGNYKRYILDILE